MAEASVSSVAALPSLSQTSGPPGQQDYGNSSSNGMGSASHMPPPPLPPVVIPQITNPIPTALTSPFVAGGLMSPGSAAGSIRRAAPEPNKRALYVGGLDPRVSEDILRQIFETTGHVQNVKIIPDKNVGTASFPSLSSRFVAYLLCQGFCWQASSSGHFSRELFFSSSLFPKSSFQRVIFPTSCPSSEFGARLCASLRAH